MTDLIELSRLGAAEQKRLAVVRAEKYRWFFQPLVNADASLSTMSKSCLRYQIRTPSGRGKWTREMCSRIVSRLNLVSEISRAA